MVDLEILEKGSFVDRVLLLDQIEKSLDPSVLPPLTEMLGRQNLDDSLRQALTDTVRALMKAVPSLIVENIASSSPPAAKIAIQLAGQLKVSEASPALATFIRSGVTGEMLMEALSSLGEIGDPAYGAIFKEFASSADPFVSSVCIRQLGLMRDETAVPFLTNLLDEAESDSAYEFCSLATAAAIDGLAAISTPEATNALINKIHHRSPTVRRLIHEILIERGESVVEPIGRFLAHGDTDEKIMAAGLLGQIRHPKGAEIMLSAMDQGHAQDPNVRFSIYDAFGMIPSLKTMICLIDGLSEGDEMTLVAVLTSLNRMVNPGVAMKVGAALAAGDAQAQKIARAMGAANAIDLFKAVHPNRDAAAVIIGEFAKAKDTEVKDAFAAALKEIATPEALADVEKLSGTDESGKKKRILAVDDSRSILMFYRAALASMGFDVATAENGRIALDLLNLDPAFDMIITDMNMPEMNGIEFTRKVRENMFISGLPIVMATTESDQSQREMADRAGVTGYLVKPIKPEALEELMRNSFS